MRVVEDGHLGGYIVGGDQDCYMPDVWKYLVKSLEIKTVIDVGCGEGHAIKYFKGLNVVTFGIDGCSKVLETCIVPASDIFIHDFRGSIDEHFKNFSFDLGWSCEFVEHVEEEYMENYLYVFDLCQYVCFTHALPNQPGYHHVNCQDDEYWIKVMEKRGFIFDILVTQILRGIEIQNYGKYSKSLLFFRREW